MDNLHNAHVGAYKLNMNHDWHVTLYKLATFGRIDASRVWELDGVVICDNDPCILALFQSMQDEQEDAWMRLVEQAEEARRKKCERVDAELQAALSPPPMPRAEPVTPIADTAPAQETAAPVVTDGASDGVGPANDPPTQPKAETAEQRQARRYQMCIDAGLTMPKNDYGPMPRGIGAIAKIERIERQSFVEDLKKYINRKLS